MISAQQRFGIANFQQALNETRLSLGWSPLHKVVIGQEGWLFNESMSNEHEDARGAGQFSAEELQRWKNYLIYRSREVAQHGGKFYFVLVPNKSSIYTEYWPSFYRKLSDNNRYQQLLAAMENTGVQVIDTKPALLAGKSTGQLYLRADTHWNMLGANFAQYEIMTRLARDSSYIQPRLYPFHNAEPVELAALNHPSDLYFMMGIRRDDPGPQVPVVEGVGKCVGIENPDGLRNWPLAVGDCSQKIDGNAVMRWNFLEGQQRDYLFGATAYAEGQGTLLMIRDSYYEMLVPYFSNVFAHAEYVGLSRPIEMEAWTWMLEAVKPDVVIEEMLERSLKSTVPRPGIDYPLPVQGDGLPANQTSGNIH